MGGPNVFAAYLDDEEARNPMRLCGQKRRELVVQYD
jgi:hypothetical protein